MKYFLSIPLILVLSYVKYHHAQQPLCTEETTVTIDNPTTAKQREVNNKKYEVFMAERSDGECKGLVRFREKGCSTCRVGLDIYKKWSTDVHTSRCNASRKTMPRQIRQT